MPFVFISICKYVKTTCDAMSVLLCDAMSFLLIDAIFLLFGKKPKNGESLAPYKLLVKSSSVCNATLSMLC